MKEIADMVSSLEQIKKKYNFFDINSWLKFENREGFSSIDNIEVFVKELSSFGIGRAVVSNPMCLSSCPIEGNYNLLSLIRGCDNLYAGPVIAPEIEFAPQDLHKYIDKLIEEKTVLVRMFPKKLNHSMKKWQVGDILNYLQYRRIPLMLWHTEIEWDTIGEICNDFPDLPLIIEGNDKKLLYHNRAYIKLLKSYGNLYIETHNLVQYLGFEYIFGELGIDRLLFGTYFPFNDPNSSILAVGTTDIDDTAKSRIAGKNMEELMLNIRDI